MARTPQRTLLQAFTITSGDAIAGENAITTTSNGAPITLTAGTGGSVSGNGGAITIQAGTAVEGDGGALSLAARSGVGTDRVGGVLSLTAGSATGTAAGGNINLTPGIASTGTYGTIALLGQVSLSAVISPGALASGATNDWNPTGFRSANVVRATPNAAGSELTGFLVTGIATGKTFWIINLSSSAELLLRHEDNSSTAANRILVASNVNFVISPNGMAALWYDNTSSRWRVVNPSLNFAPPPP